MNCVVELVDASTGEIYYNKNLGYAFAIGMPNDTGMNKLKEIIQSAIRGARIKRTPIQLRLCFTESQDSLFLPFQDINELKTPYEIKPF